MAHVVEAFSLKVWSQGFDHAIVDALVEGATNYAIGSVIGLIIGAIAVHFLTKQS